MYNPHTYVLHSTTRPNNMCRYSTLEVGKPESDFLAETDRQFQAQERTIEESALIIPEFPAIYHGSFHLYPPRSFHHTLAPWKDD